MIAAWPSLLGMRLLWSLDSNRCNLPNRPCPELFRQGTSSEVPRGICYRPMMKSRTVAAAQDLGLIVGNISGLKQDEPVVHSASYEYCCHPCPEGQESL